MLVLRIIVDAAGQRVEIEQNKPEIYVCQKTKFLWCQMGESA